MTMYLERVGVRFVAAMAVLLAVAGNATFAQEHKTYRCKVLDIVDAGKDGRLHSLQDDSPIPDYAFPGVQNERVATGLAGFIGTLAVFGLGYGVALIARRKPTVA